ncbi:putative reverse transcriptase domain-containing protein [Tanacetum coccineum]
MEMQKLVSELGIHVYGRGCACCVFMIGFMSWRATEPKTMQKAVQISGALTDEAVRNGSIKKSACPRLNRAQEPEGNRPNQVAANNGGQGRGYSNGKQAWVDKKQEEDVVVVRDFRELTNPGSTKSPYRLAPSEMEELISRTTSWNLHSPMVSFRQLISIYSRLKRRHVDTFKFLGIMLINRFIENFFKIAKSFTILTQKTFPDGPEDFVVYCDASGIGLGCVLMQRDMLIAYGLQWKIMSKFLELGAVGLHLRSGRHYLYGINRVLSQKDHKSLQHFPIRECAWGGEMLMPSRKERVSLISLDEMLKREVMDTLYYMDRLWCLNWLKVKAENQRPSGLLHPLPSATCDSRMERIVALTWCANLELSLDCDSYFTSRFLESHKSYVDKRRKPLEFSVGDYVLLKVSPRKGVGTLWDAKGKFARGIEWCNDTFHVSNLKKCLADPTLQVPLDEIRRLVLKLNFMKAPVDNFRTESLNL